MGRVKDGPSARERSRSLHGYSDATFVGDLDRAHVPGVGMPHDACAWIVGEHPFELARRIGRAVRHHDHPRMYRAADAYPAAMVNAHPRRPAGSVEKGFENRPVSDRI